MNVPLPVHANVYTCALPDGLSLIMFPYTIYTKLASFYTRVWPRIWLRIHVCISRLGKINNRPPCGSRDGRWACAGLKIIHRVETGSTDGVYCVARMQIVNLIFLYAQWDAKGCVQDARGPDGIQGVLMTVVIRAFYYRYHLLYVRCFKSPNSIFVEFCSWMFYIHWQLLIQSLGNLCEYISWICIVI